MAILVPYDGSLPAQRAVEHAVEKMGDEEIVLLHVIEASSGALAAGVDLVQERLKDLEDEGPKELTDDLRELLEESPVEFRMETVVGQPAREIVAFASENDVSHIVIGNHGREGVTHLLLGSVAEKVVERAPTTVTVVR